MIMDIDGSERSTYVTRLATTQSGAPVPPRDRSAHVRLPPEKVPEKESPAQELGSVTICSMRIVCVVILVVVQACGGTLGEEDSGRGDADRVVDSGTDSDADIDDDGDAHIDGGRDADRSGDVDLDEDEDVDADLDQDDVIPPDPCATPTPSGHLRLMSFNIHAARTVDIEAIADAILEFDPDIVGLQEIDIETGRSGGVDQISALSTRTGMSSLFAKTIDYDGGEYGIGLLTRFPILSDDRLPLPGSGEPRVLLIADLDIAGTSTRFAVTHLGLDDDTRRQQVDTILGALSVEETLALVGDFNYSPTEAPHATVTSAGWRDAWEEAGTGDGFTHSASDPRARIDYVYLGTAAPVPTCVEVPSLSVSDHLPVVVTLPWGL